MSAAQGRYEVSLETEFLFKNSIHGLWFSQAYKLLIRL